MFISFSFKVKKNIRGVQWLCVRDVVLCCDIYKSINLVESPSVLLQSMMAAAATKNVLLLNIRSQTLPPLRERRHLSLSLSAFLRSLPVPVVPSCAVQCSECDRARQIAFASSFVRVYHFASFLKTTCRPFNADHL